MGQHRLIIQRIESSQRWCKDYKMSKTIVWDHSVENAVDSLVGVSVPEVVSALDKQLEALHCTKEGISLKDFTLVLTPEQRAVASLAFMGSTESSTDAIVRVFVNAFIGTEPNTPSEFAEFMANSPKISDFMIIQLMMLGRRQRIDPLVDLFASRSGRE